MPTFNERVWNVAKRIQKGKISTYKEIAHALGCRAYRAVGQAMNKNPHAPIVPCHRVVASDGSLGGFAHGARKKALLLAQEGIEVQKGRIVDFNKRFQKLVGLR